MARTDFALALGSGLYLDADGQFTKEPPPGAPIYKPPFALPVDPDKIKPAVDSIQKALKDINQRGPALELFKRYGFDTKILDLLAGVAAIASVCVPVLAVAS